MPEKKDPQNQLPGIVKKLFLNAVLKGQVITTPLLNIKYNFKINLLQQQSDQEAQTLRHTLKL